MTVTFHVSEDEGETMVWARFQLVPNANPAMITTTDYLTNDDQLMLTLSYDIDGGASDDPIEVDIGDIDALIAAYQAFRAGLESKP